MQYYNLRNRQTFRGGFTDLYILGTRRVAGTPPSYTPTSDFTAVATTQTFTLTALAVGDCVVMPLAQAWVKQKFTDNATEGGAPATLANLKCDIGVTAATTKFIAGVNADLIQNPGFPITAPVAASVPHATQSAVNLLATLTSTAGNMSTITFGELWIYACIARVDEWLTERQA